MEKIPLKNETISEAEKLELERLKKAEIFNKWIKNLPELLNKVPEYKKLIEVGAITKEVSKDPSGVRHMEITFPHTTDRDLAIFKSKSGGDLAGEPFAPKYLGISYKEVGGIFVIDKMYSTDAEGNILNFHNLEELPLEGFNVDYLDKMLTNPAEWRGMEEALNQVNLERDSIPKDSEGNTIQ